MIQFDEHIIQMGWFNQQLVFGWKKYPKAPQLSQKQPWNSPVRRRMITLYPFWKNHSTIHKFMIYEIYDIQFFKRDFPKKNKCCIKIAWYHIIFLWPSLVTRGVAHQRVFGVHRDKGNKPAETRKLGLWSVVSGRWQEIGVFDPGGFAQRSRDRGLFGGTRGAKCQHNAGGVFGRR